MNKISNNSIDNLLNEIVLKKDKIAIHGAGHCGKYINYALKSRGINVQFFIDSDVNKHNTIHDGVPIVSTDIIKKIDNKNNYHVFIAHDYIEPAINNLRELGFKNIHDSLNLYETTDFSKTYENAKKFPLFTPLRLQRQTTTHRYSVLKHKEKNKLNIKTLDIMVTERCSMKCKDCANLMQFYTDASNADMSVLFKSLDRLMECTDRLGEFRVIGGEPFMNKEIHKAINKLLSYEAADNVIVYSNATIMPKGENLECLKNEKIKFEITNYGPSLSKKHDEMIKFLEKNNIRYTTEQVRMWDDIGKLGFEKKSHLELQSLFDDCCAKDLFTLLDGVIYKCPVSANGTKLKAVPFNKKYDGINLVDTSIEINDLKTSLVDFYNNDKYVTACHYCKGRGYGLGKVQAAIQVKEPIKYKKVVV